MIYTALIFILDHLTVSKYKTFPGARLWWQLLHMYLLPRRGILVFTGLFLLSAFMTVIGTFLKLAQVCKGKQTL